MIRYYFAPVYLRKFLRFIQPLRKNDSMDIGAYNLFMKMIEEEYKLTQRDLLRLGQRLLADDAEFEKVWKLYRNKAGRTRGGNDEFRPVLLELIQS